MKIPTAQPDAGNPQEFAAWLRRKAKAYLSMAETIDAEFPAFKGNASKGDPTTAQTDPGALSIENVRRALGEKGKAMRLSELADMFDTTVFEIEKLIDEPSSGIISAGRGWFKLETAET